MKVWVTKVCVAKVMERAGDVGEVVVGGGDLFVRPVDLFELAELVEGDLGDGGGAVEGGVPSAAGGGVEASAGGGRVGEGGVDDVGVADAIDELVDADAGEEAFLAEEAVVGRVVQLKEAGEGAGVCGEAREDGAGLGVLGGDEAVGVLDAELGDGNSGFGGCGLIGVRVRCPGVAGLVSFRRRDAVRGSGRG